MRTSAAIFACTLAAVLLAASPARADDPIGAALTACDTEIKTYCSKVTPGGGRLVSCAQAHIDKLSSECVSAINRAAFWTRFLATTVAYVAIQCKADALKYCPNVKVGEGRVLNCLKENKAGLSKYCGIALDDIVID